MSFEKKELTASNHVAQYEAGYELERAPCICNPTQMTRESAIAESKYP